MVSEPAYKALLLLNSLSSLLAILALIRRLLCTRVQLGKSLAKARAWLHKACQGPDDLGKVVCEQMLLRKVSHFQQIAKLIAIALIFRQIGSVYYHLGVGEPHALDNLKQSLIVFAMQVLNTPLVLFPGLLTPRSLDAYYSAMVVLAALSVSPMALQPRQLLQLLMLSNGLMALLNFCRRTVATRSLPLLFFCNTLFAACALSSIFAYGPERFGQSLMLWMVRWQSVISLSMALGPHGLELGITASLRQNLRFEEVRELHAAACALLRSFCDCTVELDADGVITGDSEDLGSYLMKGSFSYSLRGTRLADHISDTEDREAFQLRLREPKMELVGLAECMPVSMKDSSGNVLRLELLWFQCNRADGQRRYMVGVRELSDRKCMAAGPGAEAPQDSFSEDEKEGSSVTANDPEAAILVVDTLSTGCPIRGHSTGFIAQVGRLPIGARLASYLNDSEQFISWVQEEAMTENPGSCGVVLVLPWGQFSTCCRVLVGASEMEAVSEGLEQVGLLFTQVAPLLRERPSPLRRGTPGTANPATTSL